MKLFLKILFSIVTMLTTVGEAKSSVVISTLRQEPPFGAGAIKALSGVSKIAKPVLQRSTTLYRAVSKAKLDDIAVYGLRNKAGAYETRKLFAPTAKEAAQFGKNNFMFDGIPNTIIKVRVPNNVMQNAYRFSADGMNAVSIPAEYLQLLKANPLNFSPIP